MFPCLYHIVMILSKRRTVKSIFIIIILLYFIWLFYEISQIQPPTRVNHIDTPEESMIIDASAYSKPSNKDRKFPHRKLFRNFETSQIDSDMDSSVDNSEIIKNSCPQWIVYSANHIPLKAVGYFKSLVDKDSNWCCVTTLNKRSIELEYVPLKSDRFIVLTLEDQVELLNTASNSSWYALETKISSGKYIGYLYAISHGARLIYDTREDVRLDSPQIPLFGDYRDYVLISKEDHMYESWKDFVLRAPNGLWRHGFFYPATAKLGEYTFLKEKEYNCTHFDVENIKIINMVKVQRPLFKEKEMGEERFQLALYKGTYAVYDSATTLHDYNAFFGLLQLDNHGDRIANILRSIYIQRLLCDLGYNIAFAEGLVNPTNNPESGEESVMLLKGLVQLVLDWQSKALTIVERMEQLAIRLYERGYFEAEDVLSVQTWLVALIEAGYYFPAVSEVNECSQIPPSDILDCASNKEFLESSHTSTDTHGKNNSRVAFYLRMTVTKVDGPSLEEFYDKIFSRSLKFFWHNESGAIDLILVMDDEKEDDHTFAEKKREEYPYPTVYYEVDKECYGTYTKNRNQWSMFRVDNYTTKEYIGFLDTDAVFNSLLNEDMLFEGDKPHVHGYYGTSLDLWSAVAKASTYEFLKIKQVFRTMNYFPVVVKVKHLVEMRQYIENIHGAPFDEVFANIASRTEVAQFHIMMNYLWYFHRDEYMWHLEESQVVSDMDGGDELKEFPEMTENMKIPFPRLILHYKYIRHTTDVVEGWNPWGLEADSFKTIHKFMVEGYCFSGGFSLTPDLCTQYNESAIRITLFDFEYHSWLWDDRCLESQRAHYSSTSGLKHNWDLSLLDLKP